MDTCSTSTGQVPKNLPLRHPNHQEHNMSQLSKSLALPALALVLWLVPCQPANADMDAAVDYMQSKGRQFGNFLDSTFDNITGEPQKQREQVEALATFKGETKVSREELYFGLAQDSDWTQVQKDKKKGEVLGKIVRWECQVDDIKSHKKNSYRLTSADNAGKIALDVYLVARNAKEKERIESLKRGDTVTVTGLVESLNKDKAVLKPALIR